MPRIGEVELKEAPPEAKPKCPSCKMEMDTIWTITKGIGFIGKDQILMCPHCRSCLGFSSYKR